MLVLVLFALIIALSGCLGSTQCPVVASQTEGLVVDRFAPSYNLVSVGDKIILTMEVINRGNAEANPAKATLWSHSGFCMVDETTLQSGNPQCCLDTDCITEMETIDIFDKNYGPLQPPDMTICSPGDAVPLQWHLIAGCDPIETTFSVYLDYGYESEGYATILLASSDEAAKTQGQFSGESGENFPSAGPLQVEIEPLQTEPIIVTDFSPYFDVRILFKNVGTGLVGEEGFGEIGKTTVTAQGPCVFVDGCEGGPAATCNSVSWDENEIHLRAGDQEALKLAHLRLEGSAENFIKDVCRINVKSEYNYRTVVATKETMGVIGSIEQVERCRGKGKELEKEFEETETTLVFRIPASYLPAVNDFTIAFGVTDAHAKPADNPMWIEVKVKLSPDKKDAFMTEIERATNGQAKFL